MTPDTSMTREAPSSPTCAPCCASSATSGLDPGLLDFASIPSDAMTPRPPLCARTRSGASRIYESLESKITPAIRGERVKMQQCDKSVIACAQSRRAAHELTQSMNDQRCEHRANVLTHNEIGNGVKLGRFAIDDDETRAMTFGQQRKSRGRPNNKRRTDRQE